MFARTPCSLKMLIPILLLLLPAESVSNNNILSTLQNNSDIQSATEYARGAAGFYPNLPAGIINILQPGGLPYDVLFNLLTSGLLPALPVTNPPSSPPNVQSIALSLVVWLLAIIIFGGIGLILAIAFPVACCLFFGCRCNGKCGAKGHYYHKKNERTKCAVLAALLSASTLVAMIGAIFLLLSNAKIAEAIGSAPTTVTSAFNDIENLLNDTVNTIKFLANDQFGTIADGIVDNLQGLGNTVGPAVQVLLLPIATPLLTNGSSLVELVDMFQENLKNINDSTSTLKQQYSQLTAQLDLIMTDIQEIQTNCSTSAVSAVCSSSLPSSNSFTSPSNFSSFPDTSSQLSSINNVAALGLSGQVSTANQTLNNLGPLVNSISENATSGLVTMVEQIKTTVGGLVQTVTNITDPLFSDTGAISQIKNQINNIFGANSALNISESVRFGLLIATALIIFLLLFLILIGVLCGVVGYSNTALPADRSTLSNAGSKVLMISIIVCFILGGLMMLIAAVLFLFAAPVQKVCVDLRAPDYNLFRKVADNDTAFNGSTLLNSFVQININLNLTNILTECANNGTLWQVLQLQNLFNITGLLGNINIAEQLGNVTELASSIDLSMLNVVPAGLEQGLQDFNDSATSISNIDFNDFNQQLNMTLLGFDLSGSIQNLSLIANAFQSANEFGLANLTQNVIDRLTSINSTLLPSIETERSSLSGNLSQLQSATGDIAPGVSSILSAIDNIVDFLGSSNVTEAITDSLDTTINETVNSVTDFINQVTGALMNDIAMCRPLWAIYTSFYIFLCDSTLDGLNGLWFALGWSSVFLIPVIILSACLAPYYKRLNDPIEILSDNYHEATSYSNINAARSNSQPRAAW